ncbi:hypothetical protein [Aliiruegeria sabulilitoris]|uniref:hypothetical protein n=1 Tax=Aliiruegeria sabulilitoris TaxID=1510458 RepID=UPI00082B0471|nr:hypothetical protein [Aliiruegeria sabulilitoris]
MPLTLSLNTNRLVLSFSKPTDLIVSVARGVRLRDLQLAHEFINPSWPAALTRGLTREMDRACRATGVRATSGMTGRYGRLNHFGHPVGTQFVFSTHRDFDDAARREERTCISIDCWYEVADVTESVAFCAPHIDSGADRLAA